MSTSHQYQQAPEVLNYEFPYQSINPIITPLPYIEKPWKLSKSELRRTTILSCKEPPSEKELICSKNHEGRLKGGAKQSEEVQGSWNIIRKIYNEDQSNTAVWSTLQSKQNKLEEDKLGETSNTPASSSDENEQGYDVKETVTKKLKENRGSSPRTREKRQATPTVLRLRGGAPKKRKIEEHSRHRGQ